VAWFREGQLIVIIEAAPGLLDGLGEPCARLAPAVPVGNSRSDILVVTPPKIGAANDPSSAIILLDLSTRIRQAFERWMFPESAANAPVPEL
jgi:hypothetical protein